MFLAETYLEHCAAGLCCYADELRLANFHKPGDFTHYHIRLEEAQLSRMFEERSEKSSYCKCRDAVEEFNSNNRWLRRGISVITVQFSMSFVKIFMNQAGSLVNVYADGSVLIAHFGTEMGQGLHTKIAQVASTVFDIPINSIYISETASDKIPNVVPTAGKSGTDLNGRATMDACNQILSRLEVYLHAERLALCLPVTGAIDAEDAVRVKIFKNAANKAHLDRINLSANGYYATPDLDYSILTNTRKPFYYYAYAMACTEVEVDTLTGDHTLISSDLMEDVGKSVNPAIDIRQIEGGFVQGLRLFALEEIITLPTGVMLTRGFSLYKIPAFGDIPKDFRVTLLEGVSNPTTPAVYSSKGLGEPPVFLACSALFAIKDAVESKCLDILAALQQRHGGAIALKWDETLFSKADNENSSELDFRGDATLSPNACRLWFVFHSPATSERICNACHRA